MKLQRSSVGFIFVISKLFGRYIVRHADFTLKILREKTLREKNYNRENFDIRATLL